MHHLERNLPTNLNGKIRFIPSSQQPADFVEERVTHLDGEENYEIIYQNFLFSNLHRKEALCFPNSISWCELTNSGLTADLLKQLGAGKEVMTQHPYIDRPCQGVLRLLWGFQKSNETDKMELVATILEFLPDEPIVQGMSFHVWKSLRFVNKGSAPVRWNEPFLIALYHLWLQEARPSQPLAPDEVLLCKAVVENYKDLVKSILTHQGPISVESTNPTSIQETALGIAMENQGLFGCGAGFMAGCHRSYRDDDYTQAETYETWVPRAKMIERFLRRSGAIDYSPLLQASARGDYNEVKKLLEAGFPPNFSVYGHTTALLEAVCPKQIDVTRLLLEYGANPNIPRPFLTSMVYGGELYPLTFALSEPALTMLLLDAGANPEICQDNHYATPVVFDGDFGSKENAALIFNRVDFGSIRNCYGMNGVHFLDAENLEYCREFIPKALLDEPDYGGRTPLLLVPSKGELQKAMLLLELGADPNARGVLWEFNMLDNPRTGHCSPLILPPIQAAFLSQNRVLVEHLFAKGAIADRAALSISYDTTRSPDSKADLKKRLRKVAARLGVKEAGFLISWHIRIEDSYNDAIGDALNAIGRILVECSDPLKYYPEILSPLDVIEIAEACEGFDQILLETFKSGRSLTPLECLRYASESLDKALLITDEFELTLNDPQQNETPDSRGMLRALDELEYSISLAKERIDGLTPNQRNLSPEVMALASDEFDGGGARARQNALLGDGVDFDDFIDVLKENFNPGSTLDSGKLVAATKSLLKQLGVEIVELMRLA